MMSPLPPGTQSIGTVSIKLQPEGRRPYLRRERRIDDNNHHDHRYHFLHHRAGIGSSIAPTW